MSNEKSSGTTQSKAIELIEDELDSVVGGVSEFKSVKGITSKELELGNLDSKLKLEETKRLGDGFGKSGFVTEEIKREG